MKTYRLVNGPLAGNKVNQIGEPNTGKGELTIVPLEAARQSASIRRH